MNRRKASIRNTVIALTSEILVTVVGFMLPRAIMVNYGSETNGLITSLQQFIQYFTLLEAGLSGAAVFALYKPLSAGDTGTIERILYSAKKMYEKLGCVFLAMIALSSAIYPFFQQNRLFIFYNSSSLLPDRAKWGNAVSVYWKI